jgi:hypothetical protein
MVAEPWATSAAGRAGLTRDQFAPTECARKFACALNVSVGHRAGEWHVDDGFGRAKGPDDRTRGSVVPMMHDLQPGSTGLFLSCHDNPFMPCFRHSH